MLEVSSSIPRIALNDLVLVASANTLGCAKQVPSSLSTPPSKICLTISVLITYDWNCVFTLRPDYCSNLSCNINRWGTLIRKRILQLLNPHLKTRQGYTELWYFNGAWRNISVTNVNIRQQIRAILRHTKKLSMKVWNILVTSVIIKQDDRVILRLTKNLCTKA